jgi:hypothetical protein
VKKDLELYFPLVKEGGLICGHDYDAKDYDNPGENSTVYAVDEFFAKLDVKVESKPCYDDARARDWWYRKPTDADKILQTDIDTMCRIIDEEHL